MLIRFALASFVLVLLLPASVSALSYAQLSPTEITENTDVWIRGDVVSIRGQAVGEDGFGGTYHESVVEIDVREATDGETSGRITIRSKTTFQHLLRPDAEVFAALDVDDGEYIPYGQLGLYGWIQPDPESGNVRTIYGPAEVDVFWRYLRGLRYATDTKGESIADDRAHWSEMLDSAENTHVGLAIDYFLAQSEPHEDPLACFSAFTRAYDRVYHSVLDEQSRRNAIARLKVLAAAACRDALRQGADKTGEAIIDFLLYDEDAIQMRQESYGEDAFTPFLHAMTDPELLARIPEVYTPIMRPGYNEYRMLPTAPSEALDEWLMELIRNPVEHGVRGELELAGIVEALVNRGVQEAVPVLRSWAEGASTPTLRTPIRDVASFRTETLQKLNRLESSELPRGERLTALVESVSSGDRQSLLALSHEIGPQDQFLLPALRSLTAQEWTQVNAEPRTWPAAAIMERLSDPAFLPLLRTWLDQSESGHEISMLIEALAACGDEEEALERAVGILKSAPRDGDRQQQYQSFSLQAEIMLFIGKQRDSELVEAIVPYTRRAKLAELEDAFRQAVTDEDPWAKHPYPVWQLRDNALLAVAKSRLPNRIAILQEAYANEDIRGRFVAAFGLYALGDDTGRELIDAYREHREREIPELDERWYLDFAGGDIYSSAIMYLNDPRLDALYLERLNHDMSYSEDRDLAQNTEFFKRHRKPVLELLRRHLDHKDPQVRDVVVETLRRHTGESFGYDENVPLAQQQSAIKAWEAYIDAELAGAAN